MGISDDFKDGSSLQLLNSNREGRPPVPKFDDKPTEPSVPMIEFSSAANSEVSQATDVPKESTSNKRYKLIEDSDSEPEEVPIKEKKQDKKSKRQRRSRSGSRSKSRERDVHKSDQSKESKTRKDRKRSPDVVKHRKDDGDNGNYQIRSRTRFAVTVKRKTER